MSTTDKRVIAFAGKAGAGKTHISQQFIRDIKSQGDRVAIIAFADPIKTILKKFGISKKGILKASLPNIGAEEASRILSVEFFNVLNDLKDQEAIEKIVPSVCSNAETFMDSYNAIRTGFSQENHAYHVRLLMNVTGTEMGRSMLETIWIDSLVESCDRIFKAGIDVIFIDDLRFLNEFKRTCSKLLEFGIMMETYGIVASDETRAKRQGITLEQVLEHNKHQSEREVEEIFSYLNPENLIQND